jgi:hypothetical protein
MRYITIALLVLFFSISGYSQTLELTISNPQPRLGEIFTLSVEIDTVATNVFSFLSNKFIVSPYKSSSNTGSTIGVSLQATKLGHNDIGPLNFKIDNKVYTSNKIKFDVVDSLPPVNKGLWFRTTPIDDSTVYLIIEQRIPALVYVTHDSPTSMTMTTKTNDEDKEVEMVQDSDNISFGGSHSDYQSVKEPKNKTESKFEYFFALYKIKRNKNGNPVVISKDDFKNIPDYYVFKNILIN